MPTTTNVAFATGVMVHSAGSVASAIVVMALKGCGDRVLAKVTSRTTWSEQTSLKVWPEFAWPGVKPLHVCLFLCPQRMVFTHNDAGNDEPHVIPEVVLPLQTSHKLKKLHRVRTKVR